MLLIVGGCHSGKRTYARSLGYGESDMADAVLDDRPVVYNVQDMVRRTLAAAFASAGGAGEDASVCAGEDTTACATGIAREEPSVVRDLARELAQKEVVICCEVGNGIVPVDRLDRCAREQTGELCVLLAGQAESVVRTVCGIPLVLK